MLHIVDFSDQCWVRGLLASHFADRIQTSEWYPYQGWQMNYCVEPSSRIGRPANRLDDQMECFAQEFFHSSCFPAANHETWSSHEKVFVQCFLER